MRSIRSCEARAPSSTVPGTSWSTEDDSLPDSEWAGAGQVDGGDGIDAVPWLDRSDLVLVVTRRDPPSILKVRERAPGLAERCGDRVRLVVVGAGTARQRCHRRVHRAPGTERGAARPGSGACRRRRGRERPSAVPFAARGLGPPAGHGRCRGGGSSADGDAPGVGAQEGTGDRPGEDEGGSGAGGRDRGRPSGLGRIAETGPAHHLTHLFRREGRRRQVRGSAGDVAPSPRPASTPESAEDPAEARALPPVPAGAAADAPRARGAAVNRALASEIRELVAEDLAGNSALGLNGDHRREFARQRIFVHLDRIARRGTAGWVGSPPADAVAVPGEPVTPVTSVAPWSGETARRSRRGAAPGPVGPGRPLRHGRPPGADRRSRDREHRHQRVRSGLGHLRRRV